MNNQNLQSLAAEAHPTEPGAVLQSPPEVFLKLTPQQVSESRRPTTSSVDVKSTDKQALPVIFFTKQFYCVYGWFPASNDFFETCYILGFLLKILLSSRELGTFCMLYFLISPNSDGKNSS